MMMIISMEILAESVLHTDIEAKYNLVVLHCS